MTRGRRLDSAVTIQHCIVYLVCVVIEICDTWWLDNTVACRSLVEDWYHWSFRINTLRFLTAWLTIISLHVTTNRKIRERRTPKNTQIYPLCSAINLPVHESSQNIKNSK